MIFFFSVLRAASTSKMQENPPSAHSPGNKTNELQELLKYLKPSASNLDFCYTKPRPVLHALVQCLWLPSPSSTDVVLNVHMRTSPN